MLLQKYKPKRLGLIVGREKILRRVRAFIRNKDMPNLLFHGRSGVGKSLTAELIARALFLDSWKMNFFELNASDESGIDTIRKKVKRWAKLKTLDSAVPFKIVFLDEADFLTMNSQTALRRIMEDHYSTCRFILACNYLHKIIQPLRSRSSIFHFQPLAEPDMVSYLRKIAKQEVRKGGRKLVKLSTVKGIVSRSGGDMRMALNFLEQALEGASFSTKTTGLLDMTWKEFLPVSYEQDATVLVEQLHAEALKRKSGRMIRRLAEADRDISRGATKVIQLQALFLDLKDMAERRRKR